MAHRPSVLTYRTFLELAAVLGVVLAVAYTTIFGSMSAQLRLSSKSIDALMPQTTFLHVGGPHRGGTSVLWKLLREHPDITSMDPARGHADEGPDGDMPSICTFTSALL